MVNDAGLSPRQITLECTEQQAVSDVVPLMKQVKALRRLGFGFAIDDAGAGYASFTLIAALHPSIIKIDRVIAHGIARDDAKQALVEAFVSFGRRIGARLLAEGIEKRGDLAMLTRLGVELGQGYLIGRPAFVPRRRARWTELRLDAGPGRRRAPRSRRRPEAAPAPRPSRHREVAASRRRSASRPAVSRTIRRCRPPTDSPARPRPPLPRGAALRRHRHDRRDGAPRQAVIWFLLDGDTIVINSLEGRRWPTNLRRDPRISIAVTDADRRSPGSGSPGTVEVVDDQAQAQADIAAMARRYHAADPAAGRGAHRESLPARSSGSASGSARRAIHDHLDGD